MYPSTSLRQPAASPVRAYLHKYHPGEGYKWDPDHIQTTVQLFQMRGVFISRDLHNPHDVVPLFLL